MSTQNKIDLAITKVQQIITEYTYPVFISDIHNKPDLIASSIVIKYRHKYYLITAAHVVRKVLATKSSFIIGVKNQYVYIAGEFIYTNPSDKDHFDIAFVELSEKFIKDHNVSAVKEEKMVDKNAFQSIDIGLINGFPNSKNKQKKALYNSTSFKVKTYTYGGIIKNDFKYWDELNKFQDIHVCMSYGTKSDGNAPVDPRGISGGGLWIIPDYSHPNDYYLVGIAIEYHKKYSVTFSTKIEKVIQFINKNSHEV